MKKEETKKGECVVSPMYGKDELKQLHFYCENCGKEMGYDEKRICGSSTPTEKLVNEMMSGKQTSPILPSTPTGKKGECCQNPDCDGFGIEKVQGGHIHSTPTESPVEKIQNSPQKERLDRTVNQIKENEASRNSPTVGFVEEKVVQLGQLASKAWKDGLWHSESTFLNSMEDFLRTALEEAYERGKNDGVEGGWENGKVEGRREVVEEVEKALSILDTCLEGLPVSDPMGYGNIRFLTSDVVKRIEETKEQILQALKEMK